MDCPPPKNGRCRGVAVSGGSTVISLVTDMRTDALAGVEAGSKEEKREGIGERGQGTLPCTTFRAFLLPSPPALPFLRLRRRL